MPSDEFEKILNQAVDDAMSQLGETVRKTLSFYLRTTFDLKSEEIPRKTEEFDHAVNTLLGSGATHLESSILRNLSARIDVNVTMLINGSEVRFADSISKAEELYQSGHKV